MGSCVSIHRESTSDMKVHRSLRSKVRAFFHKPSQAQKICVGRESSVNGFDSDDKSFGFVLPAKPASPTKKLFGSKDEIFFDSRGWLDSDCEDDFLSVNGGPSISEKDCSVHDGHLVMPIGEEVEISQFIQQNFTPSGSSTPIHQSNASGTPIPKPLLLELARDQTPETNSLETSPIEKKKKLADLLKDSFRAGEEEEFLNEQNGPTVRESNMVVVNSAEGTPAASGRNSGNEKTPSRSRELNLEKERKLKAGQCCLPLVTSRSFNDRKKHQNEG